MVTIGRLAASGVGSPQRWLPDGVVSALRSIPVGNVPAVLLVVTPMAFLHVLVGTRPAGAPGPAEVQAIVTANVGASTAGFTEFGFVAQLAVVQAVVGALGDASLLQTARGVCLLACLASAVLLWPVLSRLELGGNAASAAVIIAGLGPLALHLQPAVTAGALSAFWLVLAATAGLRLRLSEEMVVAAIAATAAAVFTAPLAAVGLLALAAQRLAAVAPAPGAGPIRRNATRVAAGAAVVVALVVIVATPAAGPGDTMVGPLTLIVVLALAAAVLVRAWRRRPELRLFCTMAAAWLVCALAPGPVRLTALLLAVPVLALLVGSLVGDTAAEQWARFSVAAAAAVVVALVTGLTTVLLPTPPAPSSYRPLAGWLQNELDPTTGVAAAPLDRAELVAAGVPPDRFVPGPAPLGAAVVEPSDLGCAHAGSPDPAAVAVAVAVPAGGGLSVCAPAVPDQAAGYGPTLASSPAVVLLDPARRALQDDRVDSRLVRVLAAAAMTHDIEVTDFPPVPGEPAGARLRTAVLAGIPPAFDVEGRPAASSLQLYLAAQRPPFHPDLRTTPDGRLVVHFRLPTAGDAAPA